MILEEMPAPEPSISNNQEDNEPLPKNINVHVMAEGTITVKFYP